VNFLRKIGQKMTAWQLQMVTPLLLDSASIWPAASETGIDLNFGLQTIQKITDSLPTVLL
jgi:hypothetical protein